MKAKLTTLTLAAIAILAIGCGKGDDTAAGTDAATTTTGAAATAGGGASTKATAGAPGTDTAQLGPGAAGADSRIGTQASGGK